jgi:hypothetical protein
MLAFGVDCFLEGARSAGCSVEIGFQQRSGRNLAVRPNHIIGKVLHDRLINYLLSWVLQTETPVLLSTRFLRLKAVTYLLWCCSLMYNIYSCSCKYIPPFRFANYIYEGCPESKDRLAIKKNKQSKKFPGRALAPGKGPPVPIVQEAGWAPEPVWMQRIQEKSFASAGDRTSIVRSSSP